VENVESFIMDRSGTRFKCIIKSFNKRKTYAFKVDSEDGKKWAQCLKSPGKNDKMEGLSDMEATWILPFEGGDVIKDDIKWNYSPLKGLRCKKLKVTFSLKVTPNGIILEEKDGLIRATWKEEYNQLVFKVQLITSEEEEDLFVYIYYQDSCMFKLSKAYRQDYDWKYNNTRFVSVQKRPKIEWDIDGKVPPMITLFSALYDIELHKMVKDRKVYCEHRKKIHEETVVEPMKPDRCPSWMINEGWGEIFTRRRIGSYTVMEERPQDIYAT